MGGGVEGHAGLEQAILHRTGDTFAEPLVNRLKVGIKSDPPIERLKTGGKNERIFRGWNGNDAGIPEG